MDSSPKTPSPGGAFSVSTWLGCDEQTPQLPKMTFEERQREFMESHYPKLWQALEQLETQPIKWRT